jgi:hypothetical protein
MQNRKIHMIDIKWVNLQLKSISDRISKDSLNYGAQFEIWEAKNTSGKRISDIVSTALDKNIEIGGTFGIDLSELIKEIKNGFTYSGDSSSHPNLNLLQSPNYIIEIENFTQILDQWLKSADNIIGFWIKKGHPFYPVFWDYAFVLESGNDAYVMIASSSD